ncbi:MAG TPA: hypothetical protein VNZ57_11415 [Longimicrobiales bacterium]|nr:hypothetical protein [Longimicrobiales bacterium]
MLALIASMMVTACEATFAPIEQTELAFSIFGYLDPDADTQWVRVMPLRPLVLTSPEPSGIQVTLEELGTGRMLVLRDSVFRHDAVLDVGTAGAFVHNFWTTEPIVRGETYRFTAISPDGEESTLDVPIPSDYLVSVMLTQSPARDAMDILRVEGVPRLAFVRVQRDVADGCTDSRWEVRYQVPAQGTDPHNIPISKRVGTLDERRCALISDRLDIWVVGSVRPWPWADQLTPRQTTMFSSNSLSIPDVPTELGNAVGHLGGVVIQRVPYESCAIVGAEPLPQYCVLTYDGAGGNLTGQIRDCHGIVDLADMELEPLEFDAAGHKRIRSTNSQPEGRYRFHALETGVPYELTVSHTQTLFVPWLADPLVTFPRQHVDTLVFQPGEYRTLDVVLEAVFC